MNKIQENDNLNNKNTSLKRKRDEVYSGIEDIITKKKTNTNIINNGVNLNSNSAANIKPINAYKIIDSKSNKFKESIGKIPNLNKSVSVCKFNLPHQNNTQRNFSQDSIISNTGNPFSKNSNKVYAYNSKLSLNNTKSSLNNTFSFDNDIKINKNYDFLSMPLFSNESQKNSINKNKVLYDYKNCGGDLGNLKGTLRSKKLANTQNKIDSLKAINELRSFIKNTNNYINNVSKNYTEKYRKSVDSVRIIQEDIIDGSISAYEPAQYSHSNTDLQKKNSSITNLDNLMIEPIQDSNLKRKFSLPNLNYSTGINPSTDISSNTKEIKSPFYIQEVNQFSYKLDVDMTHESPKNCCESKNEEHPSDELEFSQLDETQLENIQIINSKIKEKEKEINLEIQNFDFIIKTDITEDRDKIIQDYMDREFSLIKVLENTRSSLMNKTSETASLSQSITELMNELNKGEIHRRKLHQYIQELRGTIRVYCRVKPNTEDVISINNFKSIVRYPEQNMLADNKELYTIEITPLGNTNSHSTIQNGNINSSMFHFDRIFSETSSQKDIFSEIKPFIQSALDGENVSIFAYGATGSGKTYTMQGPSWALDHKELIVNDFSGILPRTADYIFEEITPYEIYNESIFDLFDVSPSKQPLQIFHSKSGTVEIKNITNYQIKNKEDILSYCKQASESRRSHSTQYNENSSRSHAIYQLKIECQKNQNLNESFISIIDLAGSERCTISTFNNKTKDEIESIKKIQNEANFINKSLSTLGRIISMFADKKSSKLAIPYRESKLTMILQNCLRTNSKTVMIVTICSDMSTFQQTKDSLKFATNAMIAC